MYEKAKVIEQKKSNIGVMTGPELSFTNEYIYIKGFIISGYHDFPDSMNGLRREIGIDIGHGETIGGYIGYRQIDLELSSPQATVFRDMLISDVVWGFYARTNPYEYGVNINFNLMFGMSFTYYGFRNKPFNGNQMAEAMLTFGYESPKFPLNFSAGYNLWGYSKPIGSSVLYESSFDQYIETLENWGHGYVFKLTYNY